MACFIVVSGLPGSGKTALARALAGELRIPLLSKDVIKEALYDGLGIGDVEWSKRLGRASMDVPFALASETPGAVLESFWDPEHTSKHSMKNASATSTRGSRPAGASRLRWADRFSRLRPIIPSTSGP